MLRLRHLQLTQRRVSGRTGSCSPVPNGPPRTTGAAGSANPNRSPTRNAPRDNAPSGCPACRSCRTDRAVRPQARSRSSPGVPRLPRGASPHGPQKAQAQVRACGEDEGRAERRRGSRGRFSADNPQVRCARYERDRTCRRRRLSVFFHSFGSFSGFFLRKSFMRACIRANPRVF